MDVLHRVGVPDETSPHIYTATLVWKFLTHQLLAQPPQSLRFKATSHPRLHCVRQRVCHMGVNKISAVISYRVILSVYYPSPIYPYVTYL